MRRLRTIAQAPGELQWRLELLATLDRMRVSQVIANRALLRGHSDLKKAISHLGPIKLAEAINRQIEEKANAKDGKRWRNTVKVLISHILTALFAIVGAYFAVKHS